MADDDFFDSEIQDKAARKLKRRNEAVHVPGEPEPPKDLSEALQRIRRKPDIPLRPGETPLDAVYRMVSEMDDEQLNTTLDLQSAREKVLDRLPDSTRQQHELYEAALLRLAEEHQEIEAQQVDDFLDQAVRWLENKWGSQPCPYCQHIEWQVGTPLEISVGAEETMSPAFPVMCGNCGQTTLVNAIRAGLIPDLGGE